MSSTATPCGCSSPTNSTPRNITTNSTSTSAINNNFYFFSNLNNDEQFTGILEVVVKKLEEDVEAAAAEVEKSKQTVGQKQSELDQAVAKEAGQEAVEKATSELAAANADADSKAQELEKKKAELQKAQSHLNATTTTTTPTATTAGSNLFALIVTTDCNYSFSVTQSISHNLCNW